MPALEIPSLVGFRSKRFDMGFAQQLTPVGTQGFVQTLNRTSPFWTAEYTTPPLTESAYNEARVFLDALEGSMNTFLAWDPRRVMPQAYKTQLLTSTPWGAPSITAQNYAASTIGLGSMTVGAIITKGDYISCQVGSIWYLFRSMQTVTVGAGGTVSSLLVKPRPNIASFATTPIRYVKACAEMKMVGGLEETDDVETLPSFKFRASQFINRAGV